MSSSESEQPQPERRERNGGPESPGAQRVAGAPRPRRAGGLLAHSRRTPWLGLAIVVMVAGLLGAVLGAGQVARTETDRQHLAFHLASAEIASTLKLSIQHEEDLVVAASGFFTGNPHATPVQFDTWAESVRAMQRYPELQNIGLVKIVPAAGVRAYEQKLQREPVEPLGPHTAVKQPFVILPAGSRPFYCFAPAGISRNTATFLPPGLDICALAPQLYGAREQGVSSYAPFPNGTVTDLGIQTPVYRGGVVPATAAARRQAFLGWLGELIVPGVVLTRALEGHQGTAVRFAYDSGNSHVVFTQGTPAAGGQNETIPLHNGWTVGTFGPHVATGVFSNTNALVLLVSGCMLSLLAGLLVMVLGTGRTRALSLVREKTRELSHQALHDALTGLPNRALVLDRAEQLLARSHRNPGTVVGALFVDVDGFKHVNDKLGHAAGDRLLKVVGERLQATVRAEDTVGRLGGDEFVVLVEAPAKEAALDQLADRLIDALRQPVELEDGRKIFSVTASIGLAVGQYSTPDDLLRDADLALYAAKAAGKDRYVLFDASMYADVEGKLELELDLSEAVQNEQFVLHYQPIFDLADQRVVALEALIRWEHPERGVVPPNLFIPLAEENGLIVPIGRWVLEEACRQAAAWRREGRRLGISVNVSAYQLGRRSFAEDVRRALRDSGLKASALTLEITETTLMRDVAGASERLDEIKQLGVGIAIDDFGTGYASLSHLQRMPVDVLKVDRSFVAALNDGGQSRELLEAILGVGHALSLKVVAEGIETEAQLQTLQDMGCQMAQGFLLGRPAAADSIEPLLPAAGSSPPSAGVGTAAA